MADTFPCCGDVNLAAKGYPKPKDKLPVSQYGCCGNRMQPIQYTKPNGMPGVCLVCPVCDSGDVR
jgi:hypothetical protein